MTFADTNVNRIGVAPYGPDEPPFTRVTRPSTVLSDEGTNAPKYPSYAQRRRAARRGRPPVLLFGLGVSWFTVAAASLGVWFFLRWRNERNKPINRLKKLWTPRRLELEKISISRRG